MKFSKIKSMKTRVICDYNLIKSVVTLMVIMTLFLTQGAFLYPTFAQQIDSQRPSSLNITVPLLSEELEHLRSFKSQEVGGFGSRIDDNTLHETLPHALHAFTILLERNRTENFDPLIFSEAREIISFSISHFIDPYVRDRRPFVSFYSRVLGEESFPRAPRKAVDQVAMTAAIRALLDAIPSSDEDYTDLTSILEGSLGFLSEYLTDDEYFGWYRATIPLNLSHFTVDTSKIVIDQLMISWLYFIATKSFKNMVDPAFQQHVRQLIDVLLSNWTNPEGGVSFAGDASGTNQLRLYAADVNSLWGLVLLKSYQAFNEVRYLQAAVKVFNFLWKYFWDVGVGGLFSKIDENFDLASRSKDLVGNGLFILLAQELLAINPKNTTYRNMFVKSFNRWKQWFWTETSSGNMVRSSTVDRQGRASSIATYRDNALSALIRMQMPHFLEIQYPNNQLLGLPLELRFQLYRPRSLPLVLQVEAPTLVDELINVTITANNNEISVRVSPKATAVADYHQITVRLLLDTSVLDEETFSVRLGGNVIIPNSLLLLLGSGAFIALVIILRNPPAFLTRWQQWLVQEDADATEVRHEGSDGNEGSKEQGTPELNFSGSGNGN